MLILQLEAKCILFCSVYISHFSCRILIFYNLYNYYTCDHDNGNKIDLKLISA